MFDVLSEHIEYPKMLSLLKVDCSVRQMKNYSFYLLSSCRTNYGTITTQNLSYQNEPIASSLYVQSQKEKWIIILPIKFEEKKNLPKSIKHFKEYGLFFFYPKQCQPITDLKGVQSF